MTNGNDAATPEITTQLNYDVDYDRQFENTYSTGGLTKREYFAAMVQSALLSNSHGYVLEMTDVEAEAIKRADALILALNKNREARRVT